MDSANVRSHTHYLDENHSVATILATEFQHRSLFADVFAYVLTPCGDGAGYRLSFSS